jgi:type IV fimbrial biogenesis protein FimT
MQSKQTGVTLAELMVVVAIAGILAAVAVPSFTSMINNLRQTSTMTQITGDLNRARGEAIKRNARVLMCAPDNTGTQCGGTNWNAGWLVCFDKDTNSGDGVPDGLCDPATTNSPNPIVVRPAINANLTLTGNAAFIRFNPSGTQGTGGAATLSLVGTWSGATAVTASIAATGNISKTP